MDDAIRMTGVLDPREAWEATHCSVAKALDVVSTRTAFLLLREAFYGATRFDEFVARTGASEPVTSARLRELVDAGLLLREPYREPGQRTRQAYALTEKGRDLLPALVALMQWGDRWEQERGDGRVRIEHDGCGGRVRAELRCAEGHSVGAGELALVWNRRSPE
jgi:DNA-binding HxlR family transcriptional regulator